MSLLELALLLAVAAICGALGQSLAGFSRGGCLMAMVIGFIGAYLGAWLSRQMGLPELFVVTIDDVSFPIIWSIIGSALFVALLSLLTRGKAKPG